MTALTFTLQTELRQRVDCSPLTLDYLAGKSLEEIAAIELYSGNRKRRVDEVFAIEGSDVAQICFKGSTVKLDYIGKGSTGGIIDVDGDTGAYTGFQLKGGTLNISGSVGAYAACEMRSGEINIGGNAGDFLGAALPGNKKGMQGGVVIVRGSAGDRAGDHMRRGAILVEGNTGAYLGARMTAGTIAVLGTVGPYPGYAMKRGTLLLYRQPAQLSVTFSDCGAHTLGFLPLLLKGFQTYQTKFGSLAGTTKRVRRYAGDLAATGKGEILVVE